MEHNIEILVVDDMPTNLEVVTETLSSVGYTVAAVTSGDRALKRVKNYVPDLILLDVQMPGINGFETCEQLKSDPETAVIPIIFMTALNDIESKIKGFDLGAVDYITKPFQEQELLARVKNHIKLRQWNKTLEDNVSERTRKLQIALDQLKQFQLHLAQSEKMSALGNLVAGVGHEINNPLGYIAGFRQFARDYVQNLFELIDLYQQKLTDTDEEIEAKIDAIDLEFVRQDLPQMIASIEEGTRRIRNISTSLRTFSRTDTASKTDFNLHDGIDSTLLILKYRLKANENRPAIEVIKNYGDMPPVKCYPGQLNQVFMNILANAIDALDESNARKTFNEIEKKLNQITIITELSEDQQKAIVRIADNGRGMPEEVKARLFEQGFTTKEVGKGTGLGMAIANQIVTEKHGGMISCDSRIGEGTIFTIIIPR
ncbi:MAG: response regulator [Okeania sp. SIO1H6]|nr:response regulator [Okeania sp. SIO1H6]